MDYINDILKIVVSLGPEAKAGALVIGFGYLLRIIPPFPNKWIPFFAIAAGTAAYPFIAKTGSMSPDIRNPIVEMLFTGFLIGLLAWVFHDKLISQIENKIPGLKGMLARADAHESKRYRKDKDGNLEEVK